MNSIWNKNKQLFATRFPSLAQAFSKQIIQAEQDESFPNFWTIENAKNGSPTVKEKIFNSDDNSSVLLPLHSAYNPEREALQSAKSITEEKAATIFLGFGAGYFPIEFSKLHPNTAIILIEPDLNRFLAALTVLDWQEVFTHKECILAINCRHDEVIQLVNHYGINKCTVFAQKNQTIHAQQYFDTLQALFERNRKKIDINTNTLERFATLWLKNSCKNLVSFAKLDGVNIYKDSAKNYKNTFPAIVLAAGPSLEMVIPHLVELKKRAIIICVDTALRACLRAGVEPDFIVLIDPQFWASRHIEGLHSQSSVLITESATYPSVYRFDCRKTVLCSSLFPLGKYFESRLGEKGKIDAGGSVSTSAWDFARFIGCNKIFMAGLDLGYPNKHTHIKGSTFEQNTHIISNKLLTAETSNTKALYALPPEYAKDYNNNQILTDVRMKLFAWWFESHVTKAEQDSNTQTFTFCPQNLAIPGIKVSSVKDFLKSPEITKEKQDFFCNSESKNIEKKEEQEQAFLNIYQNLKQSLEQLYEIAKKGVYLCEKALSDTNCNYNQVFAKLTEIDKNILTSQGKDVAALVFPTEKQLEELIKTQKPQTDSYKATILRSKLIYKELCKAVKEYQNEFEKNSIHF